MPSVDDVIPIIGVVRRRGFWKLVKEAPGPGLTVGFMLVPQAIAYALLAGLPPIYGLYSSTITIFIYSLFGTSAQLSVGPVALVSLLTKGVIDGELQDPESASEGQVVAIAIALAFLVGVIQILLGLAHVGAITSFLSHDVLAGFTTSSAVIIAFSQMKYIFGIPVGRHHYPWETIADVFSNLHQTNWNELAISVSCLAILFVMKSWKKRNRVWHQNIEHGENDQSRSLKPGESPKPQPPCYWKTMQTLTSMSALVVVIVFTPISAALNMNGIPLKIVGEQPGGFPMPALPDFRGVLFPLAPTATNVNYTSAQDNNCTAFLNRRLAAVSAGQADGSISSGGSLASTLVISSTVIALIGFMESFAVAVGVQTDEDDGIDANQELIALGLANLVGSFFSSYPVAGSFGRTAVASKSGAKSTFAAAVSGLFVIVSLLLLMPAFTYLPYAVLASIIEVAVIGLVDLDAFVTAWRVSKSEFAVTLFTFVSVLALGIELGVLLGAAMSIGIALRRAAVPHMVELGKVRDDVPHAGGTWRDTTRFHNTMRPSKAVVVRVDAPIFFANTSHIQRRCMKIAKDWVATDKVIRNVDVNARKLSVNQKVQIKSVEEKVAEVQRANEDVSDPDIVANTSIGIANEEAGEVLRADEAVGQTEETNEVEEMHEGKAAAQDSKTGNEVHVNENLDKEATENAEQLSELLGSTKDRELDQKNHTDEDSNEVHEGPEQDSLEEMKNQRLHQHYKRRFVLHLSSVDYVDLSGVHMFHSLDRALSAQNIELTLSYPRGPVRDMLQRANMVLSGGHFKSKTQKTLAERTFDSIEEAIAGAVEKSGGGDTSEDTNDESIENDGSVVVQMVTLCSASKESGNNVGEKKGQVSVTS